MPGNTYGELFKITTFGESHGKAVGVVVDGCPAGLELSESDIQPDLTRRRPGQSKITTPRDEKDQVEILTGVYEGKTTGAPICMIVYSKDQRSQDYNEIKKVFRPGHADYTFENKYGGHRDPRGGGRTSARIMIGRVAAGAIAKKYLKEKCGMEFLAYTQQVGEVKIPDNPIAKIITAKDFKIETDRLILKPISFDYLEDIYENFTEEIAKYISPDVTAPSRISETAEFLKNTINDHQKNKVLTFEVTDKNREFIGLVSIHEIKNKESSFGIWVKKEAHGKGYATEMVQALIDFISKNLDIERLFYKVEERNIASRKVAEKLGGIKVLREEEVGEKTGKKFNWVKYEIPFENSQTKVLKLKQIINKLKN